MTTQPKKLIDRIAQGDWFTKDNHQVFANLNGVEYVIAFCYDAGAANGEANAEAIALLPKLLRENEQLKLQNEKFESLLYQISRSVCLDQKLSGKCLCFSCEAKAALGEK